ncbi:hypothetical protein BaRGS_00002486 [Batillaria attramentaria]|uniref:Secreted protein n=1 Tax=Batillaria attramentaria TaxID=370345 RepID=A0ABD0M383_9CAEN
MRNITATFLRILGPFASISSAWLHNYQSASDARANPFRSVFFQCWSDLAIQWRGGEPGGKSLAFPLTKIGQAVILPPSTVFRTCPGGIPAYDKLKIVLCYGSIFAGESASICEQKHYYTSVERCV